MKLTYLFRAISWIVYLAYTLCRFWLKNPQKAKVILKFVFKKMIASPKFFSRNVLIEKHSQEYEMLLSETIILYKRIGKYFNPSDIRSYKRIVNRVSNRIQVLYFIVRKIKPKIVVETGVAAGKSTGFILQALNDNRQGFLYSIDLPFQWYIYNSDTLHLDSLPPGKMPGYLIPKNLQKRWKLILGNTHSILPKLFRKLGKTNIFFHDSEHTDKTMTFEFQTSWPYIRKGGYLISDDVSFTKVFKQFSKDKQARKFIFKDLGILLKE